MRRVLLTMIFIAISGIAFQQSAAAQTSQCGQTFASSCGGPGTEMTQIINRLGLGSDCGRCKALANEMDRNGPQWGLEQFQPRYPTNDFQRRKPWPSHGPDSPRRRTPDRSCFGAPK